MLKFSSPNTSVASSTCDCAHFGLTCLCHLPQEQQDIGSEPFVLRNGYFPAHSQKTLPGYVDNKKSEKEVITISNSLSGCLSPCASPVFENYLRGIGSRPEVPQRKITFGKRAHGLKAPSLKLGESPLKETPLPIGPPSSPVLNQENIMISHQISILDVIIKSARSAGIIRSLLLSTGKFRSFGGIPAQVKVEEPGMKPVWMLTLRILDPNGGVGIETKRLLSLMNFEEVLTFPTFYGGLTAIRSLWRGKEVRLPSSLPEYGSLLTLIPDHGIQT